MIITHSIHGIGIFPCIWLIFMANVGKYTIHGCWAMMMLSLDYFSYVSVQLLSKIRVIMSNFYQSIFLSLQPIAQFCR